VPDFDRSFFDNSNFFKLCRSSPEPLLESLSDQLEKAWKSLIVNGEAESLMSEVNHLIDDFDTGGDYPLLDKVRSSVLHAHSHCYVHAVKWASVYAGLAAIVARKKNISDSRQLIASSALVLFLGYRPCSEEAYNTYVSSKGGDAQNAKWQRMRNELGRLIKDEISSQRVPFNSKIEAAEHFAPFLNEIADNLKMGNAKEAMAKRIQNWFTTNDALSGLIKKLLSETPKRRRS